MLSPWGKSCTPDSIQYLTQQDDTFYKISCFYNIPLDALIKANPSVNPCLLPQGQIICIPRQHNTYISSDYGIGFMYPARWAKVSIAHYEGIDGFFRISTLLSEEAIEDICRAEAYHKLKPYGSQPLILPTLAADLEGYLIVPASDQPAEMKNQAALIIKHQKASEASFKSFNLLILWADNEHMEYIKNSLFLIK